MALRPREAQPQGFTIGMLMLDAREPYVPGDPSNATTFDFPMLYRVVPGATVEAIIAGDPAMIDAVLAGARWLEDRGVRAIVSNCGFMLHFQEPVSVASAVPVALSSLLQIPLALDTLGKGRRLGVITASERSLNERLLALAGGTDPDRLPIGDMEGRPEFGRVLAEEPTIDIARLQAETVAAASDLCRAERSIGGVLLECSLLCPYASAVQAATGLPVWDFNTLITHVEAAVSRAPGLRGPDL